MHLANSKKCGICPFYQGVKGEIRPFSPRLHWAVGEPLAVVIVLSIVRLALGNKDIAGVPYPLFFLHQV